MKKELIIFGIAVLLIILGISSCKKTSDKTALPCIIAGEHIPLPSETNGNVECCEGLRTISPTFPSTNPEEHISSLPEGCGISVGPTPICSDCGNGKCETWENKCNCPEDCNQCSQIYDQIENDLESANYCETDSDCQILTLGGPYIKFGCYHFINKKFSKEEFRSRMMEYYKQCGEMIDECAWASNATCVSGKCVEKENSN